MPHHCLSHIPLVKTPLARLVAASLLGAASLTMPLVHAEGLNSAVTQSIQHYDIAAGQLDRVLNQFAGAAGLMLSVDARLTAGKQSQGVRGAYSVQEGAEQLLAGTGLAAQIQGASLVLHEVAGYETEVLQLAPLRVEGQQDARAGDWVYAEARSVAVISRKQMDSRPARHAADILEQTSGVYSAVSQQDPSLSVNIRGIQDYGRVNMNIDGMRQNFNKSGHGQRNGQMYIDPEMLSGVVIDKGPSSRMGGASAIAGVATFSTLDASDFIGPEKQIGGRIKLGTGDNGTHFIGSSVLAAGNEQIDILLAASERHLGDYWPGTQGNIGDIRTATGSPENTAATQRNLKRRQVTDSGYTMRSQLFKAGVNLPLNQRLQFSYLRNSTKSPNPSMLTQIGGLTELGWRSTGFSDILSSSAALDYSLSPEDSNWLDLRAKLYYVDTEDDSETFNTSTSGNNGVESQNRVRTYGVQLENTSFLAVTEQSQFSLNYGLEFFYDKATSQSSRTQMSNVTPGGNRSMTSLFSQLTYEHDNWLTLEGGLRYDRYRLRGDTGMEISTFPYTRENPCEARRMTLCPTVKVWQPWRLNETEGRFSPTFSISVKPGLEWLQLFASYGKSWRPPALTETLMTGSAHSSSTQYPNPWLDTEFSRSWETGVNVQFAGLIRSNDRLGAKLAWFDTRVENYINLEIDRVKPGILSPSSGSAAYVNNLVGMRFRGLEFQLDYDVGRAYGSLNYTRMVGSNDSCTHPAWLGGVIERGIEPTGTGTNYYYDAGSSWNGFVRCDYNTLFGSAAYLPGDRGALTLGSIWFDKRLDAGMIVRYNRGHQDDSTVNSSGGNGQFYVADWPEYTLVDLYARYQVSDNLRVNASVENIADKAYIVNYGDSISYTLGRGRTVQGSLEWTF